MTKTTIGLFVAVAFAVGAWGCGDDDDGDLQLGTRRDTAVQLPIELSGSLQNGAFSPSGDAIVFTRFLDGYNEEPAEIYVYSLDDSELRLLVSDGSGNVNLPGASWNATTEAIVFSSSRDPHDEIFIIDDAGSPGDETIVTSRSDMVAYEPSFSPDGEWIVFESHPLDVEDQGVITTYKLDGTSGYVELSDAADDCRQPNWSPAGDLILYQRHAAGGWDIWVMDVDGNNKRQVTSGEGDKTDASFSPDGQHIVYSSDAELEYANLYVIPVDGGTPVRVTDHDGYDGAPSWSSSGQIVFESYPGDPDDSSGTTLWVIDAPVL